MKGMAALRGVRKSIPPSPFPALLTPRSTSLVPNCSLCLCLLFCKGLSQGGDQTPHPHHLPPCHLSVWAQKGLRELAWAGWAGNTADPSPNPYHRAQNRNRTETVQKRQHQKELGPLNINSLQAIQLHRETKELILQITEKIWLDPLQGLEKTI